MRYSELMELFDSKESWAWQAGNSEDTATATVAGSKLKVAFCHSTDPSGPVDIVFMVNNKFTVTGKGNEFRIFSTVCAIIQDYLRIREPKSFSFSSNDNRDHGRTELYKTMVNRLVKKIPYSVVIQPGQNQTYFIFTKVEAT